ncbi:AAA family ATPase [Kutzneria buriramensis]|uniref:Regulatory LuxR family protein n=1 Tax=Kutzneria buriramensis TaxID=1045776 RepID=A0A3E0GZG8_9PSEU|nr:LuxR family transcriptional regulator [Kutzneria buriramensis]REH34753.1 regulatory LuxR family protein [Kutzneria buriramensis]
MVAVSTPKTLSGRDNECDRLIGWLAGIARGEGSALVLHGEAGIGKSALIRFATAEAVGVRLVSVSGHEAETGIEFAALHQVLHLLAAHLPGMLADRAAELARSLAAKEDPGLWSRVQVLELFRAAAGECPWLCVVDDAQWIDEPSLDALGFVARRLRSERIGMLFARRDEHRDNASLAGLTALRLAPLGRQASIELLRTVVGTPTLLPALTDIACGNPQALLELADALTPGQLRGEQPAPQTLPPNSLLRRDYQARLDRLPADARWLVLLAAADDEADVETLVRAANLSGLDIAALEPAEAAGMVHVQGRAVVFLQPLLRSVAYHEAPLTQRRAAHRCLARALDPRTDPLRQVLHRAAATDGPDVRLAAELERVATAETGRYATSSRALERAAELSGDATRFLAAAHHAWLAGEPSRAATLLRRIPASPVDVRARSRVLAGEIEMRTGEPAAASRMFLAAAKDLATRDRRLAIAALMRAGEALYQSGGHERYPEIARQALALRRPRETPVVQSMFDYFETLSETFQGHQSRATTSSRRLLALATTLDDSDMLSRTSMAALFRGDEQRAHQLAGRAMRIAETTGDPLALAQALDATSLAEFVLGRFDDVTTTLDGLRLAQDSGQDTMTGNYLAQLGAVAGMIGDKRTCLLRLRQAAGRGTRRATAYRIWALAALDLAEGRYAHAVDHLRDVIADHDSRGHLILQIHTTPHLVEAAARCGRRSLAARALRVYDSWADSTRNPYWLALSARCHALLTDNPAEAEARFHEAMRLHALSANAFDRARTGLLFGQLLRRRRKPKRARDLLHDALTTFERFDATCWAEQAAGELRAAGHPTRTTRTRPAAVDGALTPHQARIARLVADGATNREVAAQLLISARTVDHHLRAIFAKLGVRSRVELAKLMG